MLVSDGAAVAAAADELAPYRLRLADAFERCGLAWPSPKYRTDPVRFSREVLGIEPWQKQVEILEAIRDSDSVTVRSGHKCGKSTTAAIAALWYFCSFEDARVVLSSTTSRQVDTILWREVRKLVARAKRPITGELHDLARSGLKEDFREIVGFTAREPEAVAGVSGENLMYIVDEASGVPDGIFEAIEGNRAGGARLVLLSNPTRTEGEFYRSHCDEKTKKFYKAIHVSSEDTPNVVQGRTVIPALAGRAWVERKREEWGETNPLYLVRVKGEFAVGEDGKIVTLHRISEAQERWQDTEADGPLRLGIDPAGPGEAGDETAFAVRRGQKLVELVAMRGQTEAAIVVHALGILRRHRKPREPTPTVIVDSEGPIGARVFGLLLAHADNNADDFEVLRVRSSERATRDPKTYGLVRDELWANLAAWIAGGGAILADDKLAAELHAPEWVGQLNGRIKATDKRDLRKTLGRSPDRADALALACWERAVNGSDEPEHVATAPADEPDEDAAPDRVFDPYAGV